MERYVIEMFIKGEWRVWNKYEDCAGLTAKERAEAGLKVAESFAKCRLVKVED